MLTRLYMSTKRVDLVLLIRRHMNRQKCARMAMALLDHRTPPSGWVYRKMAELSPAFRQAEVGSANSYDALAQVILSYKGYENATFDRANFLRNYALFGRIHS